MAIKRLYEGFGVGQDSCISGSHPMREDDIRSGTEGVYLGPNPEAPATGLFITYWEADEIAQKIGFPHIAVYGEQKRLIDEQAARIVQLEEALEYEVQSLQLKEVLKAVTTSEKKVLNAVESYRAAVGARLGNSGGNTDAPKGAAKPAGGTKTL
jgi:hypothetical protein